MRLAYKLQQHVLHVLQTTGRCPRAAAVRGAAFHQRRDARPALGARGEPAAAEAVAREPRRQRHEPAAAAPRPAAGLARADVAAVVLFGGTERGVAERRVDARRRKPRRVPRRLPADASAARVVDGPAAGVKNDARSDEDRVVTVAPSGVAVGPVRRRRGPAEGAVPPRAGEAHVHREGPVVSRSEARPGTRGAGVGLRRSSAPKSSFSLEATSVLAISRSVGGRASQFLAASAAGRRAWSRTS